MNVTAKELFNSLLSNKAVWVPAGSWAVAQVLKVIICLIREGRLNLTYLFSMGKMPSSHTALVCALATTIAILDGFNSVTFALAALFAVVVMYDAAGLRQAVTENAITVNRILDELAKGGPFKQEHVRELIGHSGSEVLVGALLGIALAIWWT
ncbi:MAG: divergent PAP2 family protein [Chloroflexota bacterium]